MKPLFTPGPWRFDRAQDPDRHFSVQPLTIEVGDPDDADGSFHRIATLTDRWDPEWRANAALIAAAPDMAAALQYIVAWKPRAWDPEKARAMARAALDKAGIPL